MVEYQYRSKTTAMGAVSKWRDLPDGPESLIFDYQRTGTKLEMLEVRVKPTFEPGHFQYTGHNADSRVSAHWYDEDPGANYTRVNITPVSVRTPGDELSEQDLDELPVDAKVRDKDADTWTKAPNGYWYIFGDGSGANQSSGCVHENYHPIHLVSE